MAETSRQKVQAAVRKVRRRIQKIRERGERIGEQNTKAALIDPLLAALGWNLEELDEVSREYKRKPQDNPVDYALFVMRSPCLFVEAKPFHRDLSDRKWISQTLGYATVVGVKWCVLTNGNEYRLYNAHAPVDVEEKLFRSVRVADPEEKEELLDTLLLLSKEKMKEKELDVLWRAHFVDRQVKEALHAIFDSQERSLIRLIRKRTKELKPSEIRDSLKRADVRIDFPVLTMPLEAAEEREVGAERPAIRRGKSIKISELIQAGIIEPPLKIEKTYKGVRLEAEITEDGSILFEGKRYSSPSMASAWAKKTVVGAPPGRTRPHMSLGWTFWHFRDPETGELVKLDTLRQRYLRGEAG